MFLDKIGTRRSLLDTKLTRILITTIEPKVIFNLKPTHKKDYNKFPEISLNF
jgi:hypothetical protein